MEGEKIERERMIAFEMGRVVEGSGNWVESGRVEGNRGNETVWSR